MPKLGVPKLNEMYNRIERLCKERGINITQMCREADIPRGNLTDLKMGRTAALSTKSLGKISSYFAVSMDYLLGNVTDPFFQLDNDRILQDINSYESESTSTLTDRDKRDIARDLERIMEALDTAGDLQFDGDPMSDEARESIRAAMKLGLEAAKVKNKERFTPKKFRKE